MDRLTPPDTGGSSFPPNEKTDFVAVPDFERFSGLVVGVLPNVKGFGSSGEEIREPDLDRSDWLFELPLKLKGFGFDWVRFCTGLSEKGNGDVCCGEEDSNIDGSGRINQKNM